MLTNIDWIGTGEQFPPDCEQERLRRYKQNEQLFAGEHARVFAGSFAQLSAQLKKNRRPDVVFNYPQLLSKKTADFVCGEPPDITAGGQKTDKVAGVLASADFDALLYEAMMDVSRFGNAPIKIMDGRASVVAPDCWFPIVDATDLKHITCHVIAFVLPGKDEIYIEIHTPGQVELRRYARVVDGSGEQRFGRLLAKENIATGLDGFAVQVLTNITHSKSVFGMDDYAIIRPLIMQLMWRLHSIGQVLDKHSEPSLSGPGSALSYDERTGLYYLDLGNYFRRDRTDDAPIEYLTWDGNLESSFREMEFLVEQLYVLSEMGAAFMEGGGQGEVQSGTALKLRLVSPRIKSGRLAGINTHRVRKLVSMLCATAGVNVAADEIAVGWHDGIPDDKEELSRILLRASGGGAIESQQMAIRRWNAVEESEAAEILKQIHRERQAAEGTAQAT